MSSDNLNLEILEETISASLSDTLFQIEMDGSGNPIASTEELNRFAYVGAMNAFRLSQIMNSSFFQMEDGFMDWYDDQTFLNLDSCENQSFLNWFGTVNYYAPTLVGLVPQDMILQSIAVDSNGVSGSCRLGFLIEEFDVIILNTDIKVFASRDGGNTFTEAVLEVEGNLNNNFKIITAIVDLSSQPEDLHLVCKLESYGKNIRVYSSYMSWL